MLKAVIFDMDGVLVDSEPLHYEANRQLLEDKLDIELKYDYYKQFIGSTVTYMWEKMKEDFGIEGISAAELRAMADDIKEELVETEGYPEIEGVIGFVRRLEGCCTLAVASSSYLRNIERNIDRLGLSSNFRVLVSGTEVDNPKPGPDIFLEAAKRLGVEPQECVVIEDSENGVLAARAAGMACVGFINVNSGKQDLSKADYLVESFLSVDYEFLRMVHAHHFDESYEVTDTRRLVLREMLKEDAGDEVCAEIIKKALQISDMCREELESYIAEYRENAYKFLGFGLWLVELKEEYTKCERRVIGIAGIDRKVNGDFELGYYIISEYREKGYAYEACAEIMDFIRDFGLDRINVSIKRDNLASIRLAQKLMFEEFYSNSEFVFMDREAK